MSLQRAKDRWETITVGLVATILAIFAVLILAEMYTRHLLLPSALVLGVLAVAGYVTVRDTQSAMD